jgi:hypothetical protein
MFRILMFNFWIILVFIACQGEGEGVREIRGGGPNASIIRNPATADLPMDSNQLARITYDNPEFDFGRANEGAVITHVFKFTNTGKVPLVIQKARSSCGCTVPEWPEGAIPPGGRGEIFAKFNTTGKLEDQHKQIYVTANTYPNETRVHIKGYVTPQK